MTLIIKLSQLAALSDCIEGVSMERVDQYRQALRAGEEIDPISVCGMNPQGFYVVTDGNHRTLAHALEGRDQIVAEIEQNVQILNISWRWPRVSPVAQTLELIRLSSLGSQDEQNLSHR